MSIEFKTIAFYFLVFGSIIFLGIQCQKEEDNSLNDIVMAAPPPCDSLKNVRWGDTLKVVPKTISMGRFKGKTYWQAMLSSDNLIEPTKFKNNPTTHRVVIADTTEIKYNSIFIISRIK